MVNVSLHFAFSVRNESPIALESSHKSFKTMSWTLFTSVDGGNNLLVTWLKVKQIISFNCWLSAHTKCVWMSFNPCSQNWIIILHRLFSFDQRSGKRSQSLYKRDLRWEEEDPIEMVHCTCHKTDIACNWRRSETRNQGSGSHWKLLLLLRRYFHLAVWFLQTYYILYNIYIQYYYYIFHIVPLLWTCL